MNMNYKQVIFFTALLAAPASAYLGEPVPAWQQSGGSCIVSDPSATSERIDVAGDLELCKSMCDIDCFAFEAIKDELTDAIIACNFINSSVTGGDDLTNTMDCFYKAVDELPFAPTSEPSSANETASVVPSEDDTIVPTGIDAINGTAVNSTTTETTTEVTTAPAEATPSSAETCDFGDITQEEKEACCQINFISDPTNTCLPMFGMDPMKLMVCCVGGPSHPSSSNANSTTEEPSDSMHSTSEPTELEPTEPVANATTVAPTEPVANITDATTTVAPGMDDVNVTDPSTGDDFGSEPTTTEPTAPEPTYVETTAVETTDDFDGPTEEPASCDASFGEEMLLACCSAYTTYKEYTEGDTSYSCCLTFANTPDELSDECMSLFGLENSDDESDSGADMDSGECSIFDITDNDMIDICCTTSAPDIQNDCVTSLYFSSIESMQTCCGLIGGTDDLGGNEDVPGSVDLDGLDGETPSAAEGSVDGSEEGVQAPANDANEYNLTGSMIMYITLAAAFLAMVLLVVIRRRRPDRYQQMGGPRREGLQMRPMNFA